MSGRKRWIWLVLFFVGLRPGRLAAQSAAVDWSSQATFAFGQSMDFSLTAKSADVIEAATLFISAPDLPNTLTAVLPITPGRQITTNYELDLTQVRLAPFTTVTYWWRLETAVGEVSLDQQTIIYEDDQFSWREAAQDGVIVHWTGDDAGLGQLGLDIVDESLPRLTAILPVPDPLAVDIYIYPSSADLRSALRLTGRDWVGAHAHPELGVVLVTAVNSRTAAADLRQSIPHELTHFLLYQAAGPHYDSIPAWFGEGLATSMEDSAHPNYDALLATAVAQQTTIPFTELCQAFPAVEQRALLAYAQSASFIDYLQGRFGAQALRELTAAYADGMDCQSGISHVLQKSLADLNQDWLRREQPLSPFRQFWRDNGYWLLLLTGGFGLASLLIIKPRRKNQR